MLTPVALVQAPLRAPPASAAALTIAATTSGVTRVDVGGSGNSTWSADSASAPSKYLISGAPGETITTSSAINTSDPSVPVNTPASVFQSERWASNNTLGYDVPEPNGPTLVRLYTAEAFAPAQMIGGRLMDVSLQGTVADHDLDTYARVGANKGLVTSYLTSVTNGTLSLRVTNPKNTNSPHLDGLEIIPNPDPSIIPTPTPTPTPPSGSTRGPDATYMPVGYDLLVQPGQLTQALISSKPFGTKFALAAGIHRLPSRLQLGDNDQLLGFPGAVISGGKDISSGWTSDGSGHWYISGQSNMAQMPSTIAGYNLCDPANPLCYDVQDVYFDKTFLHPVGSVGAVGPGQFYFDHGAGRIYIGTNPAAHTIETPAFANIYTDGDQGTISGTNITVRNLTVEEGGNGWEPMVKGFGTSLVQNCLLRLSHMIGFTGYGQTQLINTIVSHNGQLGLGGAVAITDNSEIAYSNELDFNAGFEAGGGKYANPGSANLVIRNSLFDHNHHGNGFWFDTTGAGNQVYNNTSEYNDLAGLSIEASPGGRIYNNIIRHNGLSQASLTPSMYNWWVYNGGIGLQDSTGWEVDHNYVYDNATSPILVWTGNDRTVNGVVASSYMNIHDNYESLSGTPNSQMSYSTDYPSMFYNVKTGIVDYYGSSGSALPTNNWSNNHYYVPTSSPAGVGATWFAWGSQSQNWSTWQGAGRDAGSTLQAGDVPTPPSNVGARN